jgi:hypothetical protein
MMPKRKTAVRRYFGALRIAVGVLGFVAASPLRTTLPSSIRRHKRRRRRATLPLPAKNTRRLFVCGLPSRCVIQDQYVDKGKENDPSRAGDNQDCTECGSHWPHLSMSFENQRLVANQKVPRVACAGPVERTGWQLLTPARVCQRSTDRRTGMFGRDFTRSTASRRASNLYRQAYGVVYGDGILGWP